MRKLLIANLVLLTALMAGFSYTGDGSNGFASGESVTPTNMNEIDTALDTLEAADTTLTNTFGSYLPLAGGTMTGTLNIASGVDLIIKTGAALSAEAGGDILATAMSATGQIDDNDLAAGAVDGGTAGEIADGSITAADLATSAVTSNDILDDGVTLTTDTAGDYVATVTGDTEITVSGAGTEGRAVTLAIASAIARDTEVAAVSAASSTDNAIVRFDGTTGDVQDSLATVADTTGSITTPGALSAGGSTGASTFTMRNTADSGWVECGVVTTTFTCAVDADGTPDGTL